MSENKKKLVIVDGNSLFYRSFYALPLLTNSSGEYSNAVYGFAIQIFHILESISPSYLIVAFDASKHTFRNDLFDEYKATRKSMPDELRSQLEPLKKMLSLMNIKMVQQEGIEGDDVIGIISKKAEKSTDDIETIIVTGDRDSLQLVSDKTKVYLTKKGTSDVKIVGVPELKEEYGVTPKLFIDLKALQGDSSDNIPGVAGIGPKTALSLIQSYGGLDEIYANIDKISGKVQEKLIFSKDMAYLSKKLATILTDGDIDVNFDECKVALPFKVSVYDFFKHYEFKSLLKNKEKFDLNEPVQMDMFAGNVSEKTEVKKREIQVLDELDDFVTLVKNKGKFAIVFALDGIHLSAGAGDELVALTTVSLLSSFVDENAFILKFKDIFESEKIEKICFDAKSLMHKFDELGVSLNGYFDTMIAKNLVDGVPVTKLVDILIDDDISLCASRLFDFAEDYRAKIETEKLSYLFYEVEIPLSKVLFSMEKTGFKLDTAVLKSLREKYNAELGVLEKEIWELAGEPFNINSPKQLSVILFEKLGLKAGKKNSTSAEVLESISHKHAIVNLVLRYRKVAKFLGTYIDGLSAHIGKNNLIHTSFTQTLTTTGRLSSVEPNLQNIPIRSTESREIRSMFVASDDSHVLIDADYSQIELRLMAHFSEDENFLDAFKNGTDIHTKTASVAFGVSPDNVTPEMRRTAKVVNFGIIYGISDFGLAEDLKITRRDAGRLIDNFFLQHPAIDRFMREQVESAKKTGKAVTLFGRTRKIPDINASNFMVRSRAERASQNMPLQGTAADIIKIAMVKTYEALRNENLRAKLIMQVHDELIIDCPLDEEEKVKELLKREMINAVKLKVNLEVDIKSSFRWSEGH